MNNNQVNYSVIDSESEMSPFPRPMMRAFETMISQKIDE